MKDMIVHYNRGGKCRVSIDHERKRVLVVELVGNTGPSVTNAMESIHAIVTHREPVADYAWFEAYEERIIEYGYDPNLCSLRFHDGAVGWGWVKDEALRREVSGAAS